MGLFDRFKGKKEPEEAMLPMTPQEIWDNAFKANINFYGKEGEEPFGAVVLSEGVETVLPLAPWEKYGLDGNPVKDWKLVLVSITDKGIMGMADYRTVIPRLTPYIQGRREGLLLTRGLTLDQMRGLLEKE